MQAVHLADIVTPKKLMLNGVWYGPKKARRVVILVHGLGGNMLNSFASSMAAVLTNSDTAVLSFNNRGHGLVSKAYKEAPKSTKGYERITAGSVHEVFEDCVDDIDGAVKYARAHGAKEVYLAGHSTGCQKSVYWAYKRKSAGVKGIILLAPISDYAGMRMEVGDKAITRALSVAQKFVKAKKKHQLLPANVWHSMIDAQRFISLYSRKGNEEIFPYWDEKRIPKALRAVRVPVLVLLAENDEYADRKAEELHDWFIREIYSGEVAIIPKVAHSFYTGEKMAASRIAAFMKERYN
ncbi:MAG: alpha/beta fold hydrolase [Candidatus Pacebacteria bacterium]|nr:alpha/beta fold hydrolase [Candidatus Paceibacterota bacterium]